MATSEPLGKTWDETTSMELCQGFLEQLPEKQRDLLLAPYLSKYSKTPYATASPSTPSTIAPSPAPSTASLSAPANSASQAKNTSERSPRGRAKGSPSGRLKQRTAQSGSRKRRQINHADHEPMDTLQPKTTETEYETVPVFLQNSLPAEIRNNPKELQNVLKLLKPEATFKNVTVCRSGDIKIVASTPHDENILRQAWVNHETHGQFKPRLPKEKTANHETTILNLPTCITNKEIEDELKESLLSPKDIYRFNKKGTQEPSRNVKVTFGSKTEKESFIATGFFIYSQHFKVVENKPLPTVLQCYKCQKFGHNFFECKEAASTCLRCGGDHRLTSCTIQREQAKCANCLQNHAANYKGCQSYKEAVKNAKESEVNKPRSTSYASVAHTSVPLKPEAILACLAECLSELVSLMKTSMSKSEPLDDMAPFKIVSSAAARHMNVHFDAKDIFLKAMSPSPTPSPARPPAPAPTSAPTQTLST